jgi:site-specific recombinase XerD
MLLQGGSCDLLQIQQLLGHTRLDTTAICLHVAPEGLKGAMDRHPLSKPGAGAGERESG